MSDIELKPCPFCGKEAIKETRVGISSWFLYTVHCIEFYCCGYVTRSFKTEEEAVEAWNRRVSE